MELTEKEKFLLGAEEKYFGGRVKAQLKSMTLDDSNFVEDFEKDIILAYELLDGYTNIFIRIETLGDNFVKEFGDNFEVYCEVLNSFINKTKKCIMNIKNCEM